MPINYKYIDVKDELVRYIDSKIKEEGIANIRVLKSDPREASEIPCICVNRVNDDEANEVLGEDYGFNYDEDLEMDVEVTGTYFSETLEIRGWFQNAIDRDKIFILTKAILFNARLYLQGLGLVNITLRGGRDEQDNTFPPHPLYWFTITINYLNPLEVSNVPESGTYEIVETIDSNLKLGE